MTVNEVNRRYRAYKALQQMENDEEFGDYARPNMYPLFHEAVALPVLRDWLGWNRDTGQFDNDDTREQFYRLITPYEDEHTNQIKPPKLTTFSDIRELKYIIPNVEARQYLMDVDSSFFDARSVARKSELSKKWRYEVGQAISAMKSISAFEIPNLTGDDIVELGKVVEVAQTLITHYNVIKKSVE